MGSRLAQWQLPITCRVLSLPVLLVSPAWARAFPPAPTHTRPPFPLAPCPCAFHTQLIGNAWFLPRYKHASNQLAAALGAICCSSVACRCLASAYSAAAATQELGNGPAARAFNVALLTFALSTPVAAFVGVALAAFRFETFKAQGRAYIPNGSAYRFELRVRGLVALAAQRGDGGPARTRVAALAGGDDMDGDMQPLLVSHKGPGLGQGPVVDRATAAAVHAEFQTAVGHATDPGELLLLKLQMALFIGFYERNMHLEM